MADPELVQRAFTWLLEQNVETGQAPHFTELAQVLELTPEEAKDVTHEAARSAVGCWISHDTDYVHSWAPFSNLPTQYRISVDGEQKWYAQ